MRAVLQRVKAASVEVDGETISKIGPGIVALIGICQEDTAADIPPLVKKVLGAKLWNEGAKAHLPSGGGSDKGAVVQAIRSLSGGSANLSSSSTETSEASTPITTPSTPGERVGGEDLWGGRPWRSSVMDLEGEILCVSQFTLYARLNKGTKPDFHRAMSGAAAKELYDNFLQQLREGYRAERILDGKFGAMMDVSLTNFGPVTIQLDTREAK